MWMFFIRNNIHLIVLYPGFMMEMASWDGGISRTVQFLVPQVSFCLSFFSSDYCEHRLGI